MTIRPCKYFNLKFEIPKGYAPSGVMTPSFKARLMSSDVLWMSSFSLMFRMRMIKSE
jgi:hypothetical protein